MASSSRTKPPRIPTDDEVLGYHQTLSNWGRWGSADQPGTLNLINADVRIAATRQVRSGQTVSCARDMIARPQEGDEFGPMHRFMVFAGEGLGDEHRVVPVPPRPGMGRSRGARALEYFGCVFHGVNITHVDALAHVFWDRRTYNGGPAELVTTTFGATNLAVTGLRDGIITRGIMLDIPRVRGVEWLEPGDGVFPDDIETALKTQGLEVHEGDALLLRTGYGRRRRELGAAPIRDGQAGWHAACLPWFHGHGVAVIASDTAQDVLPSGYAQVPLPIHMVGIVAMGLCMIDNCDLEELASACEHVQRYEFLFAVAPLRVEGGTGSPVNPIAIF